MQIVCPQCESPLDLPDTDIGDQAFCYRCGAKISVTEQMAETPDVPDDVDALAALASAAEIDDPSNDAGELDAATPTQLPGTPAPLEPAAQQPPAAAPTSTPGHLKDAGTTQKPGAAPSPRRLVIEDPSLLMSEVTPKSPDGAKTKRVPPIKSSRACARSADPATCSLAA